MIKVQYEGNNHKYTDPLQDKTIYCDLVLTIKLDEATA